MNKKYIAIVAAAVIAIIGFGYACSSYKNYYEIMAVTGATPVAVKQDLNKDITLEVSGNTKRIYKFDEKSLNAFASVYLRTLEMTSEGKFEGTYRYSGIPVLNILEGIAPEKPEGAPFNRPLDMVVTFISSSGKQSHFSYGELTMTDDSYPVILAYSRNELAPSENPQKKPYTLNIHKGDVKGLRLVCPGDKDTARYLDDVTKIVLREIDVDNSGLPEMRKGFKCSSDSLKGVYKNKISTLVLKGTEPVAVTNWLRTGHGQGYKGLASTANGFSLRSVLRKNFPGAGEKHFFLFVACDGYRSIFSGKEIFSTDAGKDMMIMTKIDGKPVMGKISVAPVRDYFVDRGVWGLTHIVMLDAIDDIK
ncbi:MAG TPA: hypothetical protein PK358_00690 [Spirochaetota bacterium]|nr:hypothetical protein [Spirochaetota bacterium]HPJ33319.1 hypothetical protein [Spirochaetota bacterium]